MNPPNPAPSTDPAPAGESLPPVEYCRSCHAPIRWARHARTDKAAPIDAAPSPEGNIVLHVTAPGRLGAGLTYVVVRAGERAERLAAGHPLYLNHYVNCPQRARWAAASGAGR